MIEISMPLPGSQEKHAYVETGFPVLDTDETQPMEAEALDTIAKKLSLEQILANDMPEPPLAGFANCFDLIANV